MTWATLTFNDRLSLYLGKRRVDLSFLGRAHTAGDIIAYVPDANVMFTGDVVEHQSACYCGDASFYGLASDARSDPLVWGQCDRARPR